MIVFCIFKLSSNNEYLKEIIFYSLFLLFYILKFRTILKNNHKNIKNIENKTLPRWLE